MYISPGRRRAGGRGGRDTPGCCPPHCARSRGCPGLMLSNSNSNSDNNNNNSKTINNNNNNSNNDSNINNIGNINNNSSPPRG